MGYEALPTKYRTHRQSSDRPTGIKAKGVPTSMNSKQTGYGFLTYPYGIIDKLITVIALIANQFQNNKSAECW
jgi:hypothetical protein